jgi:hypothetical protein
MHAQMKLCNCVCVFVCVYVCIYLFSFQFCDAIEMVVIHKLI